MTLLGTVDEKMKKVLFFHRQKITYRQTLIIYYLLIFKYEYLILPFLSIFFILKYVK